MNRLIKKATVVSVLALSCSAAFAAETLTAKVVAVDGGQVVLETNGQVPAWVAKGGAVQALGWQTKVVDVAESKIVVSLAKSRAAKVKVDSDVVVREIPKQQKFGC
ncbi:MAG TPA: hypothetical protein VFY81_12535 [Gammaproteobacteria bacterium]|nr:hypothetical protein [Gammaproteobacteria bacterium]